MTFTKKEIKTVEDTVKEMHEHFRDIYNKCDPDLPLKSWDEILQLPDADISAHKSAWLELAIWHARKMGQVRQTC